MLSLAPFTADPHVADYYLARSQGCTHGAAMTKHELTEYYLGNREAAGSWVGSGAAALGMTGEIDPAAFRELLLSARTPDGVQRVRPQIRRGPDGTMVDRRVAGIDLTFRAPKSASLLFAFGDPTVAATVVAAHEHAAREGLRYLEGVATHARRGKAGLGERVAGDGFIGASFRHRDARPVAGEDHGDPLLHSHLVVANVLHAADGKWGALDSRAMFKHSKTAGYVYQPCCGRS